MQSLICKKNEPTKRLWLFFNIKATPENERDYYQEVRPPTKKVKNRKKKRTGYRKKKGGEWFSHTKETALEGRLMDLERTWKLARAVLYVANTEIPNANMMATLSELTRTNSYSLFDVIEKKKKALITAFALTSDNQLERTKILMSSLFQKSTNPAISNKTAGRRKTSSIRKRQKF